MTTALNGGLEVAGVRVELALSMPGAFNEANAAMALTALSEVGVSPLVAVTRINSLSGVAGRFTLRRWGDHRFLLSLAKNPAGFAAMLSTVESEPGDVWIAINANVADGRDPSWLYDVPFESLRDHRVYCLGDRRLDLATRLEYANVDFRVVDDQSSLPVSKEPVALVANYTAFSDWLAKSVPC
jgi:UDP-N-acetylmuramyl tripeptide synthase